jgi:hypothetical protein
VRNLALYFIRISVPFILKLFKKRTFIHSFISGYSPLLSPGLFFSFAIIFTVGMTPWTWDQPVARPLPTHRTTQTQNKRTQTSMPRVVFEPTIPAFERAKTIHALDRAATVIGSRMIYHSKSKGKVIPVLNYHAMKRMGEWKYRSMIVNFSKG